MDAGLAISVDARIFRGGCGDSVGLMQFVLMLSIPGEPTWL
jgi:hypothetical protein